MTEFRLGLGSLALDLVATVADRPGSHRERLQTPDDLDRWLVETGLVRTPGASPEDLGDVRVLREAVWSLVERSLAERHSASGGPPAGQRLGRPTPPRAPAGGRLVAGPGQQ